MRLISIYNFCNLYIGFTISENIILIQILVYCLRLNLLILINCGIQMFSSRLYNSRMSKTSTHGRFEAREYVSYYSTEKEI